VAWNGAGLYFSIDEFQRRLGPEPLQVLLSGKQGPDNLVTYIALDYAATVFPDIPREYGGGRRPTVEFSPAGNKIGPVMLLLDTGGSVVVKRPETWKERTFFRVASRDQVVALDKKYVAAVVYLPRGPRP
jgi:hypothetical protein